MVYSQLDCRTPHVYNSKDIGSKLSGEFYMITEWFYTKFTYILTENGGVMSNTIKSKIYALDK